MVETVEGYGRSSKGQVRGKEEPSISGLSESILVGKERAKGGVQAQSLRKHICRFA